MEVDCCARCPCLKPFRMDLETYVRCEVSGRGLARMSDPKAREWILRIDPSCPYWDDEEEYEDRD